MPACATPETIADQATIRNLFLPVPDTDLRDDGYASAKGRGFQCAPFRTGSLKRMDGLSEISTSGGAHRAAQRHSCFG